MISAPASAKEYTGHCICNHHEISAHSYVDAKAKRNQGTYMGSELNRENRGIDGPNIR